MANIVGQIVHKDCGCVAWVKRRANGQKLPFLHCSGCGANIMNGGDKFRSYLLNEMTPVTDDNPYPLGKPGEKLQELEVSPAPGTTTTAQTPATAEIQQSTKTNVVRWQPKTIQKTAQTPATVETKPEATLKPDEPKQSGNSSGGAVFGVISIVALVLIGKKLAA